jgi:hypothetical protein
MHNDISVLRIGFGICTNEHCYSLILRLSLHAIFSYTRALCIHTCHSPCYTEILLRDENEIDFVDEEYF